jgi:hypothetical protein
MFDIITLVWVAFVFFGSVFFTGLSIVHLVRNRTAGFHKGLLRSFSACLMSLLLCLSIWPPLHRVYYDEFSYISQSVNILSHAKAGITFKGSRLETEKEVSFAANTKLPGFAWLEAVVLFLTKDFDHSGYFLNLVLGTLLPAVVYRIAWLLSASTPVAWWSAVFLACLPARITYAMSAACDIAALFFFLLFVLFLMEYRSQHPRRFLYAALFSGIYSICIRPFYGIFMVLGLAWALPVYRREGWLEKKAYSQIWVDACCLFLPLLSMFPFIISFHSKAGFYSSGFILDNLRASFSYLFNFKQNTPLTALAAAAAAYRSLFIKRDIWINWFAGFIIGGILVISVFSGGGISYPGHVYSDRYILIFGFPLAYMAARGMVEILAISPRPAVFGALLFIALVINGFLASRHLVWEARNSVNYKKMLILKRMLQVVPQDAYVLDKSAAFITVISTKKAIHTDFILNGDRPRRVAYLQGIPEYDPVDRKVLSMVESILSTEYQCRPLMPSPLRVENVSGSPLLCELNQK